MKNFNYISLSTICIFLLNSCIETGYVRIGKPKVYDSQTTATNLGRSGEAVAPLVRQINLGTVQESHSTRESQVTRVQVRGGSTVDLDDDSSRQTQTSNNLPDRPSTSGFNRRLSEQVDDLVYREQLASSVQLVHSGADSVLNLGSNSRIYKVTFDISLFPTQQVPWKVPFLWLASSFTSSYNFTNWFSQVRFLLPFSRDGQDESLIYVHKISPKYDVLTANDSLANESQLQLGGVYQAADFAAAIEYLRRKEEQFAQQRRYPLQLGIIEGQDAWSWTFGPRRQIHQRGWWVNFVPFMEEYRVVSRLEPGMRSGHVYLVVPDINKLIETAKAPQSKDESQLTLNQADTTRIKNWSRFDKLEFSSTFFADAEIEKTIGKEILAGNQRARLTHSDTMIRIPLTISASYLRLDRPDKSRYPLPTKLYSTDEDTRYILVTSLDLPIGPPAITKKIDIDISRLEEELPQKDLMGFKVTATDSKDGDINFENTESVELKDIALDANLSIRYFQAEGKRSLKVFAMRLNKPSGSVGTNDYEGRLSATISTPKFTYESKAFELIRLPWGEDEPAPSSHSLSPSLGFPGQQITITLTGNTSPSNVSSVQFGTHRLSGSDLRRSGSRVFLIVPEVESSREVDVIIHWSNSSDSSVVGQFTYR